MTGVLQGWTETPKLFQKPHLLVEKSPFCPPGLATRPSQCEGPVVAVSPTRHSSVTTSWFQE